MFPAVIDEYEAPATVTEVLDLMQRHGENAKLIAGGQSLVPMMRLRFVRPDCLIDLNRLGGDDRELLGGIRVRDGRLEIGAMVTHADLVVDPLVVEHALVLSTVATGVADLQIRNRGTIGGSLAHADHAADYPPVVLALGADLELRSSTGSRNVPAEEFFVGSLVTALQPDELLTTITLPVPSGVSGAAYVKHSVVTGDFAIANVCTYIELGDDGKVSSARIAVGGVLPKPTLAARAAEALLGNGPDADGEAGRIAAEDVASFGDTRASAEFRSALIRAGVAETVRRAFETARGRAANGS